MYEFCEANGIEARPIGKLVVATNEEEKGRLAGLFERGKQNGVPGLKLLHTPAEVQKIEPSCTGGIAAIHSPMTGITDYGAVARKLGELATDDIRLGFEAVSFEAEAGGGGNTTVWARSGASVEARAVVTAAGNYADRVSVLAGGPAKPVSVPVRGEYLQLTPAKRSLVKGLIYPVPDPRYPWLGVHFTPTLDGRVKLGPNVRTALPFPVYVCFCC